MVKSNEATGELKLKRYKNGLVVRLDPKNNIEWGYDGRFYLGGWKLLENGDGEKTGRGYQFKPGEYCYEGEFCEGLKNGKGVKKYFRRDKI